MTIANTASFIVPFTQYTEIDYQDFMAEMELIFSAVDVRAISRAYNLSKDAHRKQQRANGRRYFDHPRELAIITIRELKIEDLALIIIEFLHDLREDTDTLDPEGIELLFGGEIARGVRIVTKEVCPKDITPEDKEIRECRYIERMIMYGKWKELVAKLTDRLHNLRTMDACSQDKRERKIKETEDHYLQLIPILAERIPAEYSYVPALLDQKINEAITWLRGLSDSESLSSQHGSSDQNLNEQ